MWELRDRIVVPKAFQINIKLTFPGTNPTREQIHAWWEAEKEVGLSLLSAAIKANRELIKRMDENSVRINTEITQEMKNSTLSDKDRELWTEALCPQNQGEPQNHSDAKRDGEGMKENPPIHPQEFPKTPSHKKEKKGEREVTEETLTEPNYPTHIVTLQPPLTYSNCCTNYDLYIQHKQKIHGTTQIIFNLKTNTSMRQTTIKHSTPNTHIKEENKQCRQLLPWTMKSSRVKLQPRTPTKTNQVIPFRTCC